MKPNYCLILILVLAGQVHADPWQEAEENGVVTQRVVHFCNRFVQGWLTHADMKSGLIPRNLKLDAYWNAKDAAADNYPFMVLTAHVTDNRHLKDTMKNMLEAEKSLTRRLGCLPDDFVFTKQGFREVTFSRDDLVFGAAEYCKDGLIPITEWMGPSPWLDRMLELTKEVWERAPYVTRQGKLPTRNIEVAGDLLQTTSRLYWLTGDDQFKEWVFRLADRYLLADDIPTWPQLRLDDHGCEIVNGLSEAYYLASRKDAERWKQYKPKIHALLDCILEKGANEDGLLYSLINPASNEILNKDFTDNWGYNYNAFLVVAEVDGEDKYRQAVEKVLSNIHKYLDFKWENGGADGYADSVEGGINLLNRIPVQSGFEWVDSSMEILLAKQRPDGIIEGWHGDGNSARTAIMYALWKTQGVTLSPWREDIQLGAARDESGALHVSIKTEWPWTGTIRFDRPRHAEYFHIPSDYARLNQFPEWFVAEPTGRYVLAREGG
ncbi:MAG: hypothetical protein GHCLOJNM_04538 [bacterium]|nr:hypothetical protein [bacterium]